LVAGLFAAGTAGAQVPMQPPAPAPSETPQRLEAPQPHSPQAPATTSERHRERLVIQLRASAGAGVLFVKTDSDPDTRRFRGWTAAFNAGLGFWITDEMALGLNYYRDRTLTLSVEDEIVDGDEPNVRDLWFSFDRIGPYFEIYQRPDGGLRGELFVGWGALHVHREENADREGPGGFTASLSGGYDWELAEHWLLGVSAGLTYASLESEEFGPLDVDVWLPTLVARGTFD
jgi:hypothetical protein